MTAITIRNNPDRLRFEILDGDTVIGHAAYIDDGGTRRIFYHTVVDEEFGGQGFAGQLAAHALQATVAAGLSIVPVCPYIKKYLGSHPQYADSVKAVTPEVLGVLNGALSRRVRR